MLLITSSYDGLVAVVFGYLFGPVPAHHSQGPPFPGCAIPTVGHWGGLGLGLRIGLGLGLGVRLRVRVRVGYGYG